MDHDELKEEKRFGRKVGGVVIAIALILIVINFLVTRTWGEGPLAVCSIFIAYIGFLLLVKGGGGGKYCGRCGKEVASSSRIGQTCPYCGAYWSDERTIYR